MRVPHPDRRRLYTAPCRMTPSHAEFGPNEHRENEPYFIILIFQIAIQIRVIHNAHVKMAK